MRILATGGAGFIGSHIADALLQRGHRVLVIDNLSTGSRKNLNPQAKFYKLDIQHAKLSAIFAKEKPDAVFHFAAHIEARMSVVDPAQDARENILGTLQVLEQCRRYGVKRFVFASSGGEVYGDATEIPTSEDHPPSPRSPYGAAKLAAEAYAGVYSRLYSVSPLVLRYGNVYGPRQNPKGEAGVVAIFASAMLRGKPIVIHGTGRQTKDYIFIDDAVQATLKGFFKNKKGVFNIGTGKETSVLEIFHALKSLTHSEAKPTHTPPPPVLFPRGCLAVQKAAREFSWRPLVSFAEGLRRTAEWYKKNLS